MSIFDRSRHALRSAPLALAILVAAPAPIAFAADTDVVAGISHARLERVGQKAQAFVTADRLAGAVTLVYRHGKIVDVRAVGWQDKENNIPMRRDTIFRLASMTKPITTVAVMTLVEDGVIAMDDPIDRWLPELANRQVLVDLNGPLSQTRPAKRPITVRDLLMFRIGLGVSLAPSTSPIGKALTEATRAGATPDEWIGRLGQLPLMADPGAVWIYNTPADVMAVLVARASGMPFEQYLQRRIFGPLNMQDTGCWVPPEKRSRLAKSYTIDPTTGKLAISNSAYQATMNAPRPPAFCSGAGGLVSTADDYLKFARMLLGGGEADGVRILSPQTVQLMTQNYLTEEDKKNASFGPSGTFWKDNGWGYGYGMSVVTDTFALGPAKGSFSWPGASGCWWSADPKNDMISIVLMQQFDFPTNNKVQKDLSAMIYQSVVGD